MYTETDPLYNLLGRADAGELPDARTHSIADDFCQRYPIHHRTSLARQSVAANAVHTTTTRSTTTRSTTTRSRADEH